MHATGWYALYEMLNDITLEVLSKNNRILGSRVNEILYLLRTRELVMYNKQTKKLITGRITVKLFYLKF